MKHLDRMAARYAKKAPRGNRYKLRDWLQTKVGGLNDDLMGTLIELILERQHRKNNLMGGNHATPQDRRSGGS